MDIPWRSVALAAVGGSVALIRFLPAYSLHISHFQIFSVLLLAIGAITAFYRILLYPYFFSPFKHLPSPSVGFANSKK